MLRESQSLLSWERGLKFAATEKDFEPARVAPLVGAWIEMFYKLSEELGMARSLLSWERGLKLNRLHHM